jgi:hypothetical protein
VSLYERMAAQPGGPRHLAAARLVHQIGGALADAERDAPEQINDFRSLSWRERRHITHLNDTIRALGGYLHDLGYEMDVQLVPAGQPRAEVLQHRAEHARAQEEEPDHD